MSRQPKRDFDRHSATGRSRNEPLARGGAGKGNWGSTQDDIDQVSNTQQPNAQSGDQPAVASSDPVTLGDLMNADQDEEQKQSYAEFMKDKQKNKPFDQRTAKSAPVKKQKLKLNKAQKETDALFAGAEKNKKKRNKKKKQRRTIQPAYSFEPSGAPAGRGRGRGGPRGDRGRGGYQGRRGGGGFGTRGRGRPMASRDDAPQQSEDLQPSNVESATAADSFPSQQQPVAVQN